MKEPLCLWLSGTPSSRARHEAVIWQQHNYCYPWLITIILVCSQGRAFGAASAYCASGDHYSITGQAQAVSDTDSETGANLLRVIFRPCIVSYHTSSQGMGSSSHFKLSVKHTADLNWMKGLSQCQRIRLNGVCKNSYQGCSVFYESKMFPNCAL